MKHILFLGQFPPPVHGVSVMNNFVRNSNLIKQEFSIDVIDFKFSTSIQKLEKFSIEKVFKALSYSFRILKTILTKKPELVYFTITPTGFGFYRDAFYVFLLKWFNIHIVLHLHGKGIKKNSGSFIKETLYQSVFNNTSVICLSKTLSEDIKEIYKGQPFLIPNGITLHNKTELQKRMTKKTVIQILYVSNFIRNKGILVLVEALSILNKKGYNFNARLVGSPSDITVEMLNKTIQESGIDRVVTVVGPLYDDAKFKEYENADIFVFPTYNDAFGLVNLEAMQYKLPVISTDEGSIPDIVIDNETGFVVEKQNVTMLAEKIRILLEDEDLRIQMGAKGYERFLNNYTLQHFEVNMLKAFKTILSVKKSGIHNQYQI